jgi:hypothetical protein
VKSAQSFLDWLWSLVFLLKERVKFRKISWDFENLARAMDSPAEIGLMIARLGKTLCKA